MFVAILWGF